MIDHSRDLAETWRRRGTAAEQQDEDAVDVRIVQSHGKAHKPRLQCFLTAAFSSRTTSQVGREWVAWLPGGRPRLEPRNVRR
jgi:hypothetical protein